MSCTGHATPPSTPLALCVTFGVGRPVCIAIHSLVAAQAGLKPRASKPGFTAGATVDVSLPSCDIFDDLLEFGFAVFFPGHEGEGAQPGTEGGHGLEDGQGLIGEAGWCVWVCRRVLVCGLARGFVAWLLQLGLSNATSTLSVVTA